MKNKLCLIKKAIRFTCWLTVSLPIAQVMSQELPKKDTVKQLDEVVITASKTPESKGNVTQKIDVVTSEKIQQLVLGSRNIAEAIQYQPGSSVSALSRNDANWGTYAGIGGKYSTYMLGGLPIDAYMDPMTLDLMAIDRIEVQRGPASVLYSNYLSQDFAGNQSPLAGTINLVLKEKIDKTLTSLSTSYGSYNTLNTQVYHQGNYKNVNYFGGISYEMSDYTNYGSENSWLNMQKDPEYKKTKLFTGITWYPAGDNKQKVTLFINKTFHTGDAGRIYRGFDNDYGIINAGYSAELNNKINFQAHMGLRQYNRTWQESNFGVIDTLKSNNGVVQNIIPVDAFFTIKHLKESSLIIGADYQGADYNTWTDPLVGYETYGNKSKAMQSGIYAQEEYRTKGLTVRGGLRYNYIKNNIELVNGGAPGQTSQDWKSLIWSLGAKYNLGNKLSVFANAGNSFLTPGLKSVGGTILLADKGIVGHDGQLPNPDLKPESGLGIDAGFDIKLPLKLNFSVRAFSIAVSDAIIDNVVSQNPSQTQSINAGNSSSTGFEVELKQRLSKAFQWFANYTYMKTKIENNLDKDQDGAAIPFAPFSVVNVGINVSMPFGLKIAPYLNYNDGYYDSSSKTGRKKFTPGALLNLSISQVIAKSNEFKLEIFGQFYNITDNRYEMPWQFKDPGFSGMGGLRATF